MPPLSSNALHLLRHLIELLPHVIPGDPSTYIGYRQLHVALGWELAGRTWGQSGKQQGLSELAEWAKEHDAPAITWIVVTQDSFEPGEGYFILYGNPADRYQWWAEQVRLAKSYDWESLIIRSQS